MAVTCFFFCFFSKQHKLTNKANQLPKGTEQLELQVRVYLLETLQSDF